MIQTQQQYKTAQAQAARYTIEIASFDERPTLHPGVHPRLIRAVKAALVSQLATLQAELTSYELLQRKPKPKLATGK